VASYSCIVEPSAHGPLNVGTATLVRLSLSELPLSLPANRSGGVAGAGVDGLSSAPLSQRTPTWRGKPAPRWSVSSNAPVASTQPAGSPASSSGLPSSSA
jgi:hypothetical protein